MTCTPMGVSKLSREQKCTSCIFGSNAILEMHLRIIIFAKSQIRTYTQYMHLRINVVLVLIVSYR
jgi:hypothetical protein